MRAECRILLEAESRSIQPDLNNGSPRRGGCMTVRSAQLGQERVGTNAKLGEILLTTGHVAKSRALVNGIDKFHA